MTAAEKSIIASANSQLLDLLLKGYTNPNIGAEALALLDEIRPCVRRIGEALDGERAREWKRREAEHRRSKRN